MKYKVTMMTKTYGIIPYVKPLPASVAPAFSLNSTLSLEGLDCWPAIPLIKVALFTPAAFLWGEKRPWTCTFVAFSRINSPCPLNVNERPSSVAKWGSPKAPPNQTIFLWYIYIHHLKHNCSLIKMNNYCEKHTQCIETKQTKPPSPQKRNTKNK